MLQFIYCNFITCTSTPWLNEYIYKLFGKRISIEIMRAISEYVPILPQTNYQLTRVPEL